MTSKTTGRMSRETFLERALDILCDEGESELRVDRLTEALGVTKGSFYWHFESRADFVKCLANHWQAVSTEIVGERLREVPDDPRERLRAILEIVYGEELTLWDLPMRAWATHDATVATVVEETDRERLSVIRGLLSELGFEGQDLELRTRVFVSFVSLDIILQVPRSQKSRIESIDALLDLLTSR